VKRKPLTMAEIESRAEHLRKQCVEKLSLYRVPVPIPVDVWVEKPLGIRLSIEDLSGIAPGKVVLGAAYPPDREIRIHDTIPRESAFRFTVAHELGHMTLHADRKVLFLDTSVEPEGREAVEREADRFAFAFLMPVDLVVREVFLSCGRKDIDPLLLVGSAASVTDQRLALWHERILPQIMKRFGVSRKAAICRLRHVDRAKDEPFIPENLRDRLLETR
jgi:hypothetical protein